MQVTSDMISPSLRLPGTLYRRLFGGSRTIEQLRRPNPAYFQLLGTLPTPGVRRREEHSIRPDGTSLRLVVAMPRRPRPGPAVLWIHGGGYAAGSPDSELLAMKRILDAHGGVVVSPDYRLSREAPYPAALDDCYAALLWLKKHANSLGGRDDQIVVAGSSAGGGLTAAITLYARDKREVNIAFQAPIYPMIDDRPTGSSRDNTAPVWDGPTNANAWQLYLGDLAGDDVPPYAAPARATDLAGLPPTITFVGSIEPFHDETVTYVQRLRAAGVPARLLIVPGAWHGFDGLAAWTPPAKQAQRWFADAFADAVQRHRASQP